MHYEIREEEGNHELTVDGLEIWVGTLAECETKLEELKSFLANN